MKNNILIFVFFLIVSLSFAAFFKDNVKNFVSENETVKGFFVEKQTKKDSTYSLKEIEEIEQKLKNGRI